MGDQRSVFCGGIPAKADQNSLKDFFEREFGPVAEVKVIMDRETGRSKGYGFITFQAAETAERVKQSSNIFFMGKMMNVGSAYRKHPDERNMQQMQGQYRGGPQYGVYTGQAYGQPQQQAYPYYSYPASNQNYYGQPQSQQLYQYAYQPQAHYPPYTQAYGQPQQYQQQAWQMSPNGTYQAQYPQPAPGQPQQVFA